MTVENSINTRFKMLFYDAAKPYASKDNASFTSASSTDSSEAGEYILNDHDSPPKSNENIFATSKFMLNLEATTTFCLV